VRISKLTITILLAAAASACSASPTVTPTRAATQTPWIIYMPVTTTPEPATVTPLPTVTPAQPTRTATRAIVIRPTATKAPPTPVSVAAAPTATPQPACNLGTVTPTFPEDGAPRNTRADGSGGSAIIFKWDPPPTLTSQTDPHNGYMIQVVSRRGSQQINGVTLYISANKYLQDRQVVLDSRAVSGLAAGDDAVATWNVTVVKTTGDFSDSDPTVRPPNLITCGPASRNMSVQLLVNQ
jgi:hypothetical protein